VTAVAGAVALALAVLAGLGDPPTAPVAPVDLGRVAVVPGTGPAAGSQQVAGLDPLSGRLERDPEDLTDFYLGSVELDLGPTQWLLTAGPLEDYDRDGRAEDLLDELAGLRGSTVAALVRLDDGGEDADVYVLNDLPYRDPAGSPPPWSDVGRAPPGPAASLQVVADTAARAVGEGALVDELERIAVGDVAWEVEVDAADGREYIVLLDVAGRVLDARPA
jgi:hypothetical protein